MDFLWGADDPQTERQEASDEPARLERQELLPGLPARPVREHQRPAGVLQPAGTAPGTRRDESGIGVGRPGHPRGDVPAEGGASEHGPIPSDRAGAGRAGVQPGPGVRPGRPDGPERDDTDPAGAGQHDDARAQRPGLTSWSLAPNDQPAPSSPKGRVEANLAALTVLRTLQEQDRAPTPDEQAQLSRWSSWGAVPGVFDAQDTRYKQDRAASRPLFSEDEWHAAARTTINAHYTQPSYAAAMWTTLTDLGFTGGTVLEPGCGAGTFIGMAPASARMIGVELDPTTAAIAAQLYPAAQVRAESFADTRLQQQVDAVIGNVPFAQVKLHDRAYNPANLSMHR